MNTRIPMLLRFTRLIVTTARPIALAMAGVSRSPLRVDSLRAAPLRVALLAPPEGRLVLLAPNPRLPRHPLQWPPQPRLRPPREPLLERDLAPDNRSSIT